MAFSSDEGRRGNPRAIRRLKIGEILGIVDVMTLSAKVQQAKQRGADFYKSQNYSQSIEEYSIAIDNGDINDDELHLYYR